MCSSVSFPPREPPLSPAVTSTPAAAESPADPATPGGLRRISAHRPGYAASLSSPARLCRIVI